MSDDKLSEALDYLDQILQQRSLRFEIVICGAYAIQLHGFRRSVHTLDVDSLRQIDSLEILRAIEDTGLFFGLGARWLNDTASTVSIPDGALDRAKPLKKWRAIEASLIVRGDLIKKKCMRPSVF